MAKKHQNEGSVYRRSDGRVVGEYLDLDGRKRYLTSKTKTKAQMKAALRQLLNDRDEGVAHDSENLTVGEYLDRWLESIRDTVRERTYQRSEQTVRLHIKPKLGKTKLDKLTALQLDGLYTSIQLPDERHEPHCLAESHILYSCSRQRNGGNAWHRKTTGRSVFGVLISSDCQTTISRASKLALCPVETFPLCILFEYPLHHRAHNAI